MTPRPQGRGRRKRGATNILQRRYLLLIYEFYAPAWSAHFPFCFLRRYGTRRRTRFRTPGDSVGTISSYRRFARLLFFLRKCDFPCLVRTSLPLPPFVRRKRLDVDL
jgi:hypothetical protein